MKNIFGIKEVATYRYLGISLDQTLMLKPHLSEMKQKAFSLKAKM
jgi:hypothetical protein